MSDVNFPAPQALGPAPQAPAPPSGGRGVLAIASRGGYPPLPGAGVRGRGPRENFGGFELFF